MCGVELRTGCVQVTRENRDVFLEQEYWSGNGLRIGKGFEEGSVRGPHSRPSRRRNDYLVTHKTYTG